MRAQIYCTLGALNLSWKHLCTLLLYNAYVGLAPYKASNGLSLAEGILLADPKISCADRAGSHAFWCRVHSLYKKDLQSGMQTGASPHEGYCTPHAVLLYGDNGKEHGNYYNGLWIIIYIYI